MTITVNNSPWFARWVEALASGEYPKTIGVLHRVAIGNPDPDRPIGYCCLGVVCELEGLDHKPSPNGQVVVYFDGEAQGDSMPPASLGVRLRQSEHGDEQWLLDGFSNWTTRNTDEDEELPYTDGLASINDEYGLTHPQHADLLRYFGIHGEPS